MLAGVLGFGLCASLVVLLQWRRTWLPLQRMLGMTELAGEGDTHLTIRAEGSSIVRCLRDALDRLLHRPG